MEIIIGSHVSFNSKNQLTTSINEALSYKANTFMFYTGAPQNTKRCIIDENITKEANKLLQKNNIKKENIIVHAPYIINLANSNNFEFNVKFLKEEIDRCESLGMKYLVLHPGSHVGLGEETGIKNIINSLNEALTENTNVFICLETMAGKGTELGKNFDELKQIIDGVKYKEKIKICMDTCHLNDSGYNISDIDLLLSLFDEKIGLDKLACIHINDSKNEIGSRKDRHENFGFGKIGFDTLIKYIYHPKLKDIPKILETPYVKDDEDSKKSYPPYKFEIEMIKSEKFDSNLLDKIKTYYK